MPSKKVFQWTSYGMYSTLVSRAKYLVGPLMTSKMLPDKRLPKHFFDASFLPSPIALRRWRKRWGSTHRGLPPASPI